MIKFLLISVLAVLLSGCSLLPRITFDKPGVVPTAVEKSSKVESCSGAYKLDMEGRMISCEKGYKNNQVNYKQIERAQTLQERISNFFRNLVGVWFWVLIALIIFFPGAIGWLIGNFFNGAKKALEGTVKAIGRFKSKVPTIVVNGQEVPDPTYALAVDALLDELEIQHSKDPGILKTICDIRLKLKIEDND